MDFGSLEESALEGVPLDEKEPVGKRCGQVWKSLKQITNSRLEILLKVHQESDKIKSVRSTRFSGQVRILIWVPLLTAVRCGQLPQVCFLS